MNINIKQTLKTTLWTLFPLIFFTVSCQSLGGGTPQSNSEYYAGRNAGEIQAKKDAIVYNCTEYPVVLRSMVRNNINAYLAKMNVASDSSYAKGFKWGYRIAFRDYTDAYCNNGGEDDYYGHYIR